MGWRYFRLMLLGCLLTISLSCSWRGSSAQVSPPPAEAIALEQPAEPSAAPSAPTAPASTPPPLPPATQAIVAQAGPNGLYDPPRGDERIVVISDLNSAYGSTDYDPEVDTAIQLLPFWNPDLVLCSGDMVAGQSLDLSNGQLQAMWDAFDSHVAAPLRQLNIPFGFTIGNHDASGARSGGGFIFHRERDIASQYWTNPAHDPGLTFSDRYQFPFYYTFTHNNIFVLVWDGSTSSIPADKLAWIEQALASPAAQQAQLRILLGHLPLYGIAVGRDQPGEVMDNADALRQLLEQYNVHTYISGHQHAYYPGHKGNLQLLHAGLLGSGPRQLITQDAAPWKALTVIDVNADDPNLTTYTTYNMQTLATVGLETLPRSLTGHNGMILRRDVSADSLSQSEREQCLTQLGAIACAA